MGQTGQPDELLDALRRLTGRPDAQFRPHQREAVEALVRDRARVLVVQRTGWGKSAVYFLATRLLRDAGLGPTLLISPLLALMRNQIDAATRLGLRSMTVNSSSATTVNELAAHITADDVDLILVSPERLANPEFADQAMPLIGARPGLMVIDEVHCISDWGHDFRPDYRRIGKIVDRLDRTTVPVLGCTATANDRVVADVGEQLGAELTTFRGSLGRDGLALSALRLNRQAERLAWLAASNEALPGSGIIYCLTVRDTENVTEWLIDRGFNVDRYFGALDGDARIESERRLQNNEIKALVATTALGMGYDKPDLGFVVHFQAPGSAVAYYQQVGRAGRALDRSVAVLLRGVEDADIQDFFITHAFAAPDVAARVLAVFDTASGPVSLNHVMAEIDIKLGPLELVVKQLDVDGALRRVKARTYERTLQPWTYPTERVESVTAARRVEQAAMREYLETTRCRMQFLTDLLDDPARDACGICDNCTGASAALEVPTDLLATAEAFLRSRPLIITPKRQGVAVGDRVEEGRALAQWGDAGWGALVREGRQENDVFDERLIDALAEMIRVWRPEPAPEWVTAVPSLRRPRLVDDAARALASRMQLPYEPCVVKIEERPEQRYQQNRSHQEANVAGAFAINGPVPSGPVLLVDDLVGSGWTITEVGRVLRRAGSGPVHPVALASTAGRET